MAKIIIRRKSSVVGSAQSHRVYVYDTFVGELSNGGFLEVPVGVGTYMINFNSTMKMLGKNTSFNVIVNDPNEIIELETQFGTKGEYEVGYAYNRTYIPTDSSVVNAPIQNNDNLNVQAENTNTVVQQTGIYCHRCGSHDIMPVSEVSTSGKDFDTGNACCGYLLCGPLGLLCGTTGKGKQTTTTTYWMCRGCGNKFQA